MSFDSLQQVAERVGWTLLHSCWQFAAIALGMLFLRRLMSRCTSSARYTNECIGLAAMVACAIITFACIEVLPATRPSRSPVASTNASPDSEFADGSEKRSALLEAFAPPDHSPVESQARALPPSVGSMHGSQERRSGQPPAWHWLGQGRSLLVTSTSPWLGKICGLWLTGVMLLSLRPFLALTCVLHLQRRGTSAVPGTVQRSCERLTQQIGVKRAVRIVQSTQVAVPTMVGWIRPTILLPASAIAGLPAEQLRAVISHEIAHIRRHDYLINAIQVLVETLFFYHPAIWWLSNQIRVTREECCDDMAVEVTGDRTGYARLLVWLDEHRNAKPSTSYAMSASGGTLIDRVRRIVQPETASNASAGFTALLLLLLPLIATSGFLANAVAGDPANAAVQPQVSEVTSEAVASMLNAPQEDKIAIQSEETNAIRLSSERRIREGGNVHDVCFVTDAPTLRSVAYVPGTAKQPGHPRIRTWDLRAGKFSQDTALEWQSEWTRFTHSLILSADAERVFGSLGNRLAVWDASSGELIRKFDPQWDGFGDLVLQHVSASRAGDLVACSGVTNSTEIMRNGYLFAWKVETGALVQSVTSQHTGDIKSMALSPDGRQMAAWPAPGGVGIWDLLSGEPIVSYKNENAPQNVPYPEKFPGTFDQVLGMQFSPDGATLAFTDPVGVKLLDAASGRLRQEVGAPFRYYDSPEFAFSPESQLLLRCGVQEEKGQNKVFLWDLKSDKLVGDLDFERLTTAAFSSDGNWLAMVDSSSSHEILICKLSRSETRSGDASTDQNEHRQKESDSKDQAYRDEKLPWRAFGKVVDINGQPLAGVTIRAATGMRTLIGGNSTQTNEQGRYDFRFGFGIHFMNSDETESHPQTQVAQVTAHLAGYFEENFSRHGNGMGSLQPVLKKQLEAWDLTEAQVVLPGRPREINFVMLPAAQVSGVLVDENDQPLSQYSVSLTGEQLPPGSSVLRQVSTDALGRFKITEVPTTAAYQFAVRLPRDQLKPPWNDSWASMPITFRAPGRAGLALQLDTESVSIDELVVQELRLKIVGPGVHGDRALRAARETTPFALKNNGRLSASRMELSDLTLELKND